MKELSQEKRAPIYQARERFNKMRAVPFDTRSYKTTEKDVTKPVYGVNAKGESIFIETRKFNANRDYLWAIPLEEVDLAQGALKQNPGWD